MTRSTEPRARVLIADDDEINLMLLREALETADFDVDTVTDGATAMRAGIEVSLGPAFGSSAVSAELSCATTGEAVRDGLVTSATDSRR